MKNVTSFNDLDFHEAGITARQAYGIGEGILFSSQNLASLTTTPQDSTGFVELRGFKAPSNEYGNIQRRSETVEQHECNQSFMCTEYGCIATFTSFKEIEDHILIGLHQMETRRQTSYDHVRQEWAKYCNDIVLEEKKIMSWDQSDSSDLSAPSLSQGWALKTIKGRPRFSKSVKDFLRAKFEEGEHGGRKVTPQEVSLEMKTLRDVNGERIFTGRDCLSTAQIVSYFSRLSRNPAQSVDESHDEDLAAIIAELDENKIFDSLNE